jgi:hypothetical protein
MKAEVVICEGTPELFIDGVMVRRTLGRLAEPGYNAPEKIDQYREAGIDIFFTSLHEANNWCWDGADGYDYETYESHLDAILDAKPDAKLIVYVGGRTGVPYLWSRAHENELVLRADGARPRAGSFGSDKWFADSTDAVRRFVRHFEKSPYAGNIIGYNPIYLNSEWLAWLDHGSAADFSQPMVECFRRFLRERYRDDVSALRRAWKDPNVTFDIAAIPTASERQALGHRGIYHGIENYGWKVADYYRCYNGRVAQLAISFCRAAKEESGFNKLAGLMQLYNYGYPDWPPNGGYSGHCDARALLESDYIDYFHSPYEYFNRCFGGVHYSQQAADAVTARGKLHIDQIDSKTYIHPPPNTNSKSPWETWQILKRDVANSLTRNSHHYYYEMSVGCFRGSFHPTDWRGLTYGAKDISGWIAALTRLAEENQRLRSPIVADCALVTSTEGHYVRSHREGYSNLFNVGFRQHVMPYIGAPFCDYILEDFGRISRPHKIYLFPTAHYVPADLRAAIHRKLAAEKATALWFYGAGYVDENGPSLDNIERLTGFKLRKHDTFEDFLQIDVCDFDHPITSGLKGDRFPGSALAANAEGCAFGSDLNPEYFRARQEWAWFLYDREKYRFSPAFSIDDPQARVLGTLRGLDLPAFGVKQMDGWTSVYVGAPYPSWKLISNLIRFSGGHLYSETQDLIYANSRFVAFQCNGDGEKTLQLRGDSRIEDPLENTLLAERASRFSFAGKHGEVRFFRITSP